MVAVMFCNICFVVEEITEIFLLSMNRIELFFTVYQSVCKIISLYLVSIPKIELCQDGGRRVGGAQVNWLLHYTKFLALF